MKFYVLVSDYGSEGLDVRGATESEREAQMWAGGDYHDYVPVDTYAIPCEELKPSKRALKNQIATKPVF